MNEFQVPHPTIKSSNGPAKALHCGPMQIQLARTNINTSVKALQEDNKSIARRYTEVFEKDK